MKKIFIVILCASLISCDQQKPAIGSTNTAFNNNTGENNILQLDIATLKDEPAFLQAWKELIDGRIADDKKRSEDKTYKGYYLDYLKKHTALQKATTAFSQTVGSLEAVSFNEKVNAIQRRTYVQK